MMKINIDDIYGYFALGLFILASILYLHIDGVPLDHPGNIKAADGTYHTLAADRIIETQQWNYYNEVDSLGQDKLVNIQPPLFHMNAAVLTTFSGVPPWVTYYFLVCMAQAFLILIVYLITYEIFNNYKTAIVAAGFAVLPATLSAWLYTLYINIWNQIGAYFFIMCFLWLFIRYMKRDETWTLFFMGLCIISLLLLHGMDLIFLLLPTLIVAVKLLKNYIENKDFKHLLKRGLLFGLFPLIVFIPLIPKFIFVWGTKGTTFYKIAFYGFRDNWFTRNYLGGYVFPDIFFIPTILLIVFIIGFVQIILNKNKYRLWILTTIYYFAIVYLPAIFVQEPHYFSRARSLTPFIIYPTISYAIYYFIERNIEPKFRGIDRYIPMAIAMIIVIFSIPSYTSLTEQTKYEQIPLQEWHAYEWVHKNTDEKSKILFFGSVFQSEFLWSKRITAAFGMDEMQRLVNEYVSTNITPIDFNGAWGGDSLRAGGKYEITQFKYGDFIEPVGKFNLLDFDYVFFQNIAPQITQVNYLFANSYIINYGFVPVYDSEGYIILKNEKKNQ